MDTTATMKCLVLVTRMVKITLQNFLNPIRLVALGLSMAKMEWVCVV